jgi:hypothetical protein
MFTVLRAASMLIVPKFCFLKPSTVVVK